MTSVEILSLIKSIGIFGVSFDFNFPEPQVSAARRVIAELEDHRALYTDIELQDPKGCEKSIREIRDFLISEIRKRPETELSQHLKGMAATCRKLLTKIEAETNPPSERPYWVMGGALGELRGVFGMHIAAIAAKHHLDVHDELAKILPGLPDSRDD